MKAIPMANRVLHFFIGIGAMAGGLGALLNPTAPMGISVDVLRNGPFKDFLIPGIVLFGLLGVGNVAAGFFSLCRSRWQGYVTGVLGGALVIWIVVQCVVMWSIEVLHVLYFLFGAVQCLLALALLWKENLFPTNIARALLKRFTGRDWPTADA